MLPSSSVADDGVLAEVRDAHKPQTCGPPPPSEGDPVDVNLLLVQDHYRIAVSMNDIVVCRLFSAGLRLQTALGLIGSDHPACGRFMRSSASLTWPSEISGPCCSVA